MGTKNNPGKFDCYAKLDPDEPYFTLRSTDKLAPYLVGLWYCIKSGNIFEAIRLFAEMAAMSGPELFPIGTDVDAKRQRDEAKWNEAVSCQEAMTNWRLENK